jgi:peptidoglycan hydrolase-like protein with peptidoglycan-binding domain
MSENDVPGPGPDLEEQGKNPAVEAPPGALVELTPVAGGEVTKAADLSYIDEVVDAPKPKKVKVPVVQDEKFPAPVKVESLVFRARMKNSQSVRLVQAELVAQGYTEAAADVQGWLCEGTRAALARFQTEHGLVGGGDPDEATIAALFENSTTHYWER